MRERLQAGLTIAAVLGLFAIVIDASDNYTVNHGANLAITAHSTCGMVTNNSATGRSVYVPTQSSLEWQSFRTNPPAGVTLSSCVTPGSQTFSTPGTYSFTIPAHNTMTVRLWGAGAGGNGSTDDNDDTVGVSGGASSWDGGRAAGKPEAGGGAAGAAVARSFPGNGGGAGGVGYNCSSTTAGQPGGNDSWRQGGSNYVYSGKGGDGGNGGVGGASVYGNTGRPGKPGSAPGGGGGGSANFTARKGSSASRGWPGGGGGAYCTRTYSSGVYEAGSTVTVIVGAGGAGGNSIFDGGAGAGGRVEISWQ
jgi:hypothetical protein